MFGDCIVANLLHGARTPRAIRAKGAVDTHICTLHRDARHVARPGVCCLVFAPLLLEPARLTEEWQPELGVRL